MTEIPRFSIVVPTYERPESLTRLLEAIVALDRPRGGFEVILVDDGGGVELEPVVAPFREHMSLTLLVRGHAGPAAARQAGIDVARGSILVFTDDDCRPRRDWLTTLAAALDRSPRTGFGGCVVNALHGNLCAEASQQIITHLCGEGRLVSPRFFTTNNLAFPADDFRGIGGLDRTWEISGGEDRDLCERWQRAGLVLDYLPDAIVEHEHALGLFRFMRQHFHYGRGAWRFRNDRPEPLGLARPIEYARLVASGWSAERPVVDRIAITQLIALAQVATAAGFAFEGVRRRRRGGQARAADEAGESVPAVGGSITARLRE